MPFRSIRDDSRRLIVDDNPEMITGLMDPLSSRVSQGQLMLDMTIRLRPTPLELTELLPLMGFALDSGVWKLEEDIDEFTVIIDRVAKVHTYATCKVNQFVLWGQVGQPVNLDLQIIGTSLTEGNAGTFSATAMVTDAPYPFSGGTLTLKSSTRVFDRFQLASQHFLERQFENSLTANCIDMTRRETTLATSLPYISGNTALLTTPMLTGTDGAAATLAFARGGQSTSIAFTHALPLARMPSIMNKQAIRLDKFYRLYRTVSTKAYEVTHDDTV